MKRVLITGASGFVGANLARRMLKDGHKVCLLLRNQSDTWRLDDLIDEFETVRLDMLDYNQVSNTVSFFKPELIFHLAVSGAYSWQTDWNEIVDTNLRSTINLVEACAKVGFDCFVNTGSSSEYGFYDHAPQENEPVEPNSYYAITKAAGTMTCRHVASRDSLKIPTLRLYSVYGPYEDPRRLMPTLIKKGLAGELPPLVDPSIARDYVYIDDVVEAYLSVCKTNLEEHGAVFNVGTGVQTSIEEIVSIARKELKIEAEPSWGSMENRVWDSSIWVANNEKIKSSLDWTPVNSVAQGFHKFCLWVRENERLHERYVTLVNNINQ